MTHSAKINCPIFSFASKSDSIIPMLPVSGKAKEIDFEPIGAVFFETSQGMISSLSPVNIGVEEGYYYSRNSSNDGPSRIAFVYSINAMNGVLALIDLTLSTSV